MTEPRAPSGASSDRILVVEDDPEIRESLREILEEDGHRVTTAQHGREALDRLAEIERPCLILLDLMMPVMSGPELLEELRERPAWSTIPVVIVSAYAQAADATCGVAGFIGKPVNLTALLSCVRRFCT